MANIQLPSLGHFENRNGWLGSVGELRFQIETPQKSEDGPMTANVVLWQGPFSRPYAQIFEEKSFPVTQEGLETMIAYLSAKGDEVNAAPPFTAQEVMDYYWAKKQEEDEKKA